MGVFVFLPKAKAGPTATTPCAGPAAIYRTRTQDNLKLPSYEQHPSYLLDRSAGLPRGSRIRMVFLSRDDALQRGNGPHERDRGPRPSRRDGLLATTIQSRNGRLSDSGAVLRLPRLRTGRAEPVGSVRIPHGRPFLRLGRLYRHADRDLRLGPHGACREPVAESRAQSSFPQRRSDGSGRRRPRSARHLGLVPGSESLH